jgi:virulence-associated protein VagC
MIRNKFTKTAVKTSEKPMESMTEQPSIQLERCSDNKVEGHWDSFFFTQERASQDFFGEHVPDCHEG